MIGNKQPIPYMNLFLLLPTFIGQMPKKQWIYNLFILWNWIFSLAFFMRNGSDCLTLYLLEITYVYIYRGWIVYRCMYTKYTCIYYIQMFLRMLFTFQCVQWTTWRKDPFATSLFWPLLAYCFIFFRYGDMEWVLPKSSVFWKKFDKKEWKKACWMLEVVVIQEDTFLLIPYPFVCSLWLHVTLHSCGAFYQSLAWNRPLMPWPYQKLYSLL